MGGCSGGVGVGVGIGGGSEGVDDGIKVKEVDSGSDVVCVGVFGFGEIECVEEEGSFSVHGLVNGLELGEGGGGVNGVLVAVCDGIVGACSFVMNDDGGKVDGAG